MMKQQRQLRRLVLRRAGRVDRVDLASRAGRSGGPAGRRAPAPRRRWPGWRRPRRLASGPPLKATTVAWTSAWRAWPSLRDAQVDDELDPIDTADPRLERVHGGVVGGRQPAVAGHHERGRGERGVLERRRQGRRLHARRMLAGRKPLVVSLATSPSDGRKRTARTVTTIQTTTIRKRKRTEKRPRLVKNWLIEIAFPPTDQSAAHPVRRSTLTV